VFAQAEAVYSVYPDLAENALRADPVFESSSRVLGATLFTVAARADEDVGLVVPDLRRGLPFLRRYAVARGPDLLLELLLFLGDGLLRLRLPVSTNRVNFTLNENRSRKPVYHARGTGCMIRCRRDYTLSKVARRREG
jgi:hypothetical protein